MCLTKLFLKTWLRMMMQKDSKLDILRNDEGPL
jgi:hypothetical protein